MSSLVLCLLLGLQDSPVESWRGKVRVRPLVPDLAAHTIHSYYLATPESSDGRHVLLYASTTREGYEGEIRILERATGKMKIVAPKVVVEDAHRAACQQWIGKRVVFHDFRDGVWVIARVDVETLEERVLVKGRQLGFGAPKGDLVPIYGPHCDPGASRDLELLNVETGEIRAVLRAAAVKEAYPEWISKNYDDRPISIFFPVLSPDGSRLFFKLASPVESNIDRKSTDLFRRSGSLRKGLLACDLNTSRLTFPQPLSWGHPAWHPDGRQILEVRHVLIDSDTGMTRSIPGLPAVPGSPHPSVRPDGKLFVADFTPPLEEPRKGFWSLLVGDLRGRESAVIHTFDGSRGAASWRRGHPHPVFSPDGRRIYFNAASGDWTQLCVAELAD